MTNKIFICFIFFLSFFCVHFSRAQSVTIEKIVAVIDDEMITLSFLESYKKLLSSEWIQSNILLQITSKKKLIQNKKILLNHLIDQKIILNNLSQEELKQQAPQGSNILQKLLVDTGKTQKEMMRDLDKIGMPLKKYENWLRDNYIQNQFINMEIASTIAVTDQEINDYYFQKEGRPFFKGYQYELNQWQFPSTQEGKRKIREFVLSKDRKKFPFTFKVLKKSQMNSQIEEIISKISVGQFSKPNCLRQYCFVFELVNKFFYNDVPQQSEKIRAQLMENKFKSLLKNWIKTKKETASIKIYL